MGMTGNLQTIGLPDVLQLLSSGAKTGTLVLTRCDDTIKLYFQDGKILYAVFQKKRDSLLNFLARNHDLDLESADKILTQARSTKQSIEKTLLNSNVISRETLMNAAMLQAKETVYDLFQWMEGDFEFLDGELPEGDELALTLSLATFNLIMEGSRRIDEWGRIRKTIPSMDLVFRLEGDPTSGAIQFNKDEWQVLSLLDGTRNVRTICQMTSKSEFEVCRILYGLKSANFIQAATQVPGTSVTRGKTTKRWLPYAIAGGSVVVIASAVMLGMLLGSPNPPAPVAVVVPSVMPTAEPSPPPAIATPETPVVTSSVVTPEIPSTEEEVEVEPTGAMESGVEAVIEATPTIPPAIEGGRIDINTASIDELMTLPKIGPSTAKNIIEYRETNGPFRSPGDLKNVPRIGDKTFEGLKDLIRCGSVIVESASGAPAGASGAESKPSSTEASKSESAAKSAAKSKTSGTSKSATGAVVNINKAGLDELDSLPGIGPAIAQRIIDYRKEHGPFRNKSEINDVKGIGDKLYERIEDLITVQ